MFMKKVLISGNGKVQSENILEILNNRDSSQTIKHLKEKNKEDLRNKLKEEIKNQSCENAFDKEERSL